VTEPVRQAMRRRTLLIGLRREPPESPPAKAQVRIGCVAAQTPTPALSEDSFSYRRCVSVRSGMVFDRKASTTRSRGVKPGTAHNTAFSTPDRPRRITLEPAIPRPPTDIETATVRGRERYV